MNGLYFNEDYKGVIELDEYRVYLFFGWLKDMKEQKGVEEIQVDQETISFVEDYI